MTGCDRADETPAACLVAGTAAPVRCTAGVARLDIVRSEMCSRMGIAGTMSNPARPEERQKLCGKCSARVPRAMSLPLPLPLIAAAAAVAVR